MSWVWLLVGLVALQRLAELFVARRNTRRLLAAGGVEVGAGHYPLIVLTHVAWLAAMLVLVPPQAPANWPLLGLFVLLQVARAWVLVSLGRLWTTRIITAPGAPLVRHGPYRYLRHPNYVIVAAEIAVLPLVFGAWEIATTFSVLNGILLAHRVRIENRALAGRRPIPA
ncbi:MAG: isoprenylcysteine carboxylmethyltransferase family protein [Gammaproteobacteria bacterium]|nr:MAG: isoprenylcysteine carboxylmethyltransferase family protein [Gammaproteobacteria bacterium]